MNCHQAPNGATYYYLRSSKKRPCSNLWPSSSSLNNSFLRQKKTGKNFYTWHTNYFKQAKKYFRKEFNWNVHCLYGDSTREIRRSLLITYIFPSHSEITIVFSDFPYMAKKLFFNSVTTDNYSLCIPQPIVLLSIHFLSH